ncbi:MAG: GFA family protein [Halieaceae bacterium]|jgi:hypothetical protein|nr:GFA family protein [Halieaceae bacterium]
MRYEGSCHCGAVTFQVEAEHSVELERCNCSICAKSGYLHLIVPKAQFQLLTGTDALATYCFNSGVAQHYFCTNCGIKPFYVPRSNPDCIDVNVNCLDSKPEHMTITPFDGQNWEKWAHTLAHKSNPAS